MPNPIPPIPLLWLRKVYNKITGQKSALDLMTPSQQARLSPDFRRILAATPAERLSGGVAGNYTGRSPALPYWLSPGKVIVNSNVGPKDLDYASLHESLHAYDYATGHQGEKEVTGVMTPELARQLAQIYNSDPNTTKTLSPDEYYATLGAAVDAGFVQETPAIDKIYRSIIKQRKPTVAPRKLSVPSLAKKMNRE